MSRIALLLAFLALADVARAVPSITRPVVDPDDLLTASQSEEVATRLVSLRERTGVQMAVLVVYTTLDVPIDDYAQTVFATWGGGSKTRNDGVLFVLAVGDRRNRLEIGRGLEDLITDSRAAAILEGIKPKLRDGNYGGASLDVVDGVADLVSHLTPSGEITIPSTPFGTTPKQLIFLCAIPWLLGVLYLLLGIKKASHTPSISWRKTIQKLPTLPLRTRNLALWIGGPLVFLFLFLALGSIAMFPGYFVAWYMFAGMGIFAGLAYRQGPVRSFFYTVIIAMIVVVASQASSEPIPDALTLISIAFSFAIPLVLLTVFFVVDGGGGIGGGSSSSGSGWSSSGSGWSSGSSSSSRSSSGSSWSGGGGRSGGGGASSSW